MGTHRIMVTIENRPGMDDPEGRTILNDLVLREGAAGVTDIRCSKNLVFTASAEDGGAAAAEVRRICEEMRIYNPLVSQIRIREV